MVFVLTHSISNVVQAGYITGISSRANHHVQDGLLASDRALVVKARGVNRGRKKGVVGVSQWIRAVFLSAFYAPQLRPHLFHLLQPPHHFGRQRLLRIVRQQFGGIMDQDLSEALYLAGGC